MTEKTENQEKLNSINEKMISLYLILMILILLDYELQPVKPTRVCSGVHICDIPHQCKIINIAWLFCRTFLCSSLAQEPTGEAKMKNTIVTAVSMLIAVACTNQNDPSQIVKKAPVAIENLSADKTTVTAGESVRLAWEISPREPERPSFRDTAAI